MNIKEIYIYIQCKCIKTTHIQTITAIENYVSFAHHNSWREFVTTHFQVHQPSVHLTFDMI